MRKQGDRFRFVALEGLDGSGKSSIRQIIEGVLAEEGIPFFIMGHHSWLDPETTRIIVDIREQRRWHPSSAISEAYFIDKRIQADQILEPALRSNHVLGDRSVFADAVYHEAIYGVPAETTLERHRRAGTRLPDLVVLIDAPPADCYWRILQRSPFRRFHENLPDLTTIDKVYRRLFFEQRPAWLPPVRRYANPEAPTWREGARRELAPLIASYLQDGPE